MTRVDRRAMTLIIAGFTVWSAGFILLYTLQALGCAYEWPAHRAILIGAFVAVLVPLCWLSLMRMAPAAEPVSTLSTIARWANRAALASGFLVFIPVTFASTCI